LNSFGRRRFAVAGPSTWNSLTGSLRVPELSLVTFKRQISWLMNMQHALTRAVRKHLGWWRGVVVTRLIRSAKLLYAGPG